MLDLMELVTKARSHKEGCCVYICKVDDNGKICDRRITDFDNIPDGFVSVDKTVFYNSSNWQFVEGEFVKIIPESAELPTMGARLAAAEQENQVLKQVVADLTEFVLFGGVE